MALSLRRPQHRFLSKYPLLHHYFSSSSNDHSTPPPHQEDETQHHEQPNPNLEQSPTNFLQTYKRSLQNQRPNEQTPTRFFQTLKETLQKQPPQRISFEDSYKRNKPLNGTSPPTLSNLNRHASASFSVDKIRETLKNLERRNPPREQNVLPSRFLGGNQESVTNALRKHYSHEDLGEKLRSLRPVHKEEGWFSLQELNERLKKLNNLDLNRPSTVAGLITNDITQSFLNMKRRDEADAVDTAVQNVRLISKLSSSTSIVQLPPKEQLLEKYFHPDNMSAEEKMKIELAKVRDEFKISESDCGSARVQVAQLTTKIKHLSAVLHKKDKHSRKGLQEMVQRRKKLLKYLRRTDWESYCFVISKLGLRDNPDFKESHKKRLST